MPTMGHSIVSCRVDASDDFLKRLAKFRKFGKKTRVKSIDGITYFINQFWTPRQRQGHRLQEVSYRGCFKPQLPAFFIDRLTQPGDIVYDPFMGRGTTLVEAALKGRVPFGNDINPLSRALTEPRIHPPTLNQIEARLDEIPWDEFVDLEHEELLVFYHPKTLARLEGLRRWFRQRNESGTVDPVDRWIRMVAVTRLTGHSARFFSGYTLPPNQAATLDGQRKINARKNLTPPEKDVRAILEWKSKRFLSQGVAPPDHALFLTGEADKTPQIPDDAVSLTVTSPPFLDVVNYETDNWLRCWFLGIDPKSVNISQCRGIKEWQPFIKRTLAELARVTRRGGHVAFEVGEVKYGKIRLEENVIAATEGLPFETLGVMVVRHDFTKTSQCWGVANNSGGTNSNRVVLLQKSL